MTPGVPGRLRPRIFSTFGTTRVVGGQPNASAASTPREIPGTHFQRLSRPQGTWFCRKEPQKKFQVTPPGIDPGTVRLVAQRYMYIYIYIYIYTYNKSEDWNVWGTEGQGPVKELNVTLVSLLQPYIGGSRVWIYWVVKVILLEHPRVKWRS